MSGVVAVIDDDPIFRAALKRLLSSLGYTVELYASGEAFFERAAECRTRCLLIDVQLGSRSVSSSRGRSRTPVFSGGLRTEAREYYRSG